MAARRPLPPEPGRPTEDVGAGSVEMLGDCWQLVGDGVEQPVELGVHLRLATKDRSSSTRSCSTKYAVLFRLARASDGAPK
jgi:hypothetical protein